MQISNMDQIYGRASSVIVAAAGEDPYYGLPGVSKQARQYQRALKTGTFNLMEMVPSIGADVARSKWASRAWYVKLHKQTLGRITN